MSAWIHGQPVAMEDAFDAGGALLAVARQPLVAGLACEVDAIQAAYRLASDLGGVIDPVASTSLYSDLEVLATAGAMMTTPGEAAGRADVVVALGSTSTSPLTGRLAAGRPTRGRAAGAPRTLVTIGAQALTASVGKNVRNICEVEAKQRELPETLGTVRALVNGRKVEGGIDPSLVSAADVLRSALFGVVLYDPAELGVLAVDMLHGLVKDLNRTTRLTSLSLSANVQQQSVLQVGAWTTGDAPRVGFARGFPEHDPWRFDAGRLVQSGEVDAVLWLASLPVAAPEWLGQVRGVAVVGRPAGHEAEVVIEVAVPGETIDGVLWDEQRSALVYRAGDGSAGRARASGVLARIAEAAGRTRGAAC